MFNTVVRWRKLDEVENEWTSHNCSLFAIFLSRLSKLVKILHSFFFETRCRLAIAYCFLTVVKVALCTCKLTIYCHLKTRFWHAKRCCCCCQPSSIRGLAARTANVLRVFRSSTFLTNSPTERPVHSLILPIRDIRGLPTVYTVVEENCHPFSFHYSFYKYWPISTIFCTQYTKLIYNTAIINVHTSPMYYWCTTLQNKSVAKI